MDRKIRAGWELLLPICLALASGCGRGSLDPSDAAPGMAPAGGKPIAGEPHRLPSSVLATGYRGQSHAVAAPDVDPDTRFGSPSIDPASPESRWLEAAESESSDATESLEAGPPPGPPLPSLAGRDGNLQPSPEPHLSGGKIRQPAGAAFEMPPSEDGADAEDALLSGPPPVGPLAAAAPSIEIPPVEVATAPSVSAAPEVPAAPSAAAVASTPAVPSAPPVVTSPTTASAETEPPVPAIPAVPANSPVVSVGPVASGGSAVEELSVDELSAAFPSQQTMPEQQAGPTAVGSVLATAAPQEPIPWASPRPRSAEMDAVSKSAQDLVRQGFWLAERGAVYSARLKFFAALSLISRSLDAEQQTQVYSRALAAGRTALTEAWDFHADGVPRNIDLARIVAAHRTRVLADLPLDSLSPITAQQHYFSFAQEQLALATGNDPAASMALFGLAKTAAVIHGAANAGNMTVAGEQMACYQAALIADNRNFCAMHELGVLLASHGRPELARDLFLGVLAISENAATWRNLSVVWEQLGDSQQALRAAQHADKLSSTRIGELTGSNLRLVDPQTFARTLPPSEGLAAPAAPASTPAPAAPKTAGSKKRMAFWPWKQETVR